MNKLYKVISVNESITLKNFIFGAIPLPIAKVEEVLNQNSTSGWDFESMVIEKSRMFLFWERESAVIVLSKNK
ncbi:MAG: DUF4177 domain-containing protein [Spirochaetes bacterium]|jgi:hypothetical protein|nr:DUF4177 domain-containing protein [Spirochaetota bacterium]